MNPKGRPKKAAKIKLWHWGRYCGELSARWCPTEEEAHRLGGGYPIQQATNTSVHKNGKMPPPKSDPGWPVLTSRPPQQPIEHNTNRTHMLADVQRLTLHFSKRRNPVSAITGNNALSPDDTDSFFQKTLKLNLWAQMLEGNNVCIRLSGLGKSHLAAAIALTIHFYTKRRMIVHVINGGSAKESEEILRKVENIEAGISGEGFGAGQRPRIGVIFETNISSVVSPENARFFNASWRKKMARKGIQMIIIMPQSPTVNIGGKSVRKMWPCEFHAQAKTYEYEVVTASFRCTSTLRKGAARTFPGFKTGEL